MPKGERLFKSLAALMLRRFYGTLAVRLECGKVAHVTTETARTWECNNLPEPTAQTGTGEDSPGCRMPGTEGQSA